MVPRTRLTSGSEDISFTSITSLSPSHRIELGPTSSASALWRRALRPRSVMVKRDFGPYVATLIQQWFCGSRRPDHRYHGENTDPMNPMTEMAQVPSSLSPSTYHQ